MKTKFTIQSVLLLACGLLLCGGVGEMAAHAQKADNNILLEKRDPGYWGTLSDAALKRYRVLRSTADERNRTNFLVESAAGQKTDTYSISMNADGSVTFKGTNGSENDLYYVLSSQSLADGEYYYSDGEKGDSPSTDSIQTYLEGVSYQIGGGTEYPVHVPMPGDGAFTADHTQVSAYQVVLKIAAETSSQGITFYPMISKEGGSYSPAVSLQANTTDSQENSYSYGVIQSDSSSVRNLTEEDWQIFMNRTASRTDAWTTVALENNQGIELREGKLYYGALDPLDRVNSDQEVDLTELSGKLQDDERQQELRDITGAGNYLEALSRSGGSITVIIAIRDEGISALTQNMREDLEKLGLNCFDYENPQDMYRHSYVAVIDGGNVLFEQESPDSAVQTEGSFSDGTPYRAVSLGWNAIQNVNAAGEDSSDYVLIDGENYCMNRRGMNIVVYDTASHKVTDSVCFDTCSGLRDYRTIGQIEGVPLDGGNP